MIPFENALQIVCDAAVPFTAEESVPLRNACGRILSADIQSDIDMPPFDKSAMDGYAYRIEDADKPLQVIETIAAGYMPQKSIGSGECAKIMTGGVVPDGADCVVMIEHTEIHDTLVHITKKSHTRNICYKAEDVAVGDIVLHKGTRITPAEIAILASVGCDPVTVSRQPVCGVIATGSELVEPSQRPEAAQIRNSNSYQLCCQLERNGCTAKHIGIVNDSSEAIKACIEENIPQVDMLLLSGGVSMGEYDYVPEVLQKLGFNLLFQKVAIKPGKPTVFGRKGDKYVFGMPGNPVSTFMIFELLVKPFCYRLMGSTCAPVNVKALLSETIKREKSDRLSFLPVLLNEQGTVHPLSYHGSAHIHALTRANGYIAIPVGINEIPEGEEVTVTIIK